MVTLLVLVSKTGGLMLMGVLNGLRGRLDGSMTMATASLHMRNQFSCLFFILFLSVKYPPVQLDRTLEISLIF